jgi:RNA polymerase sigma-70 factor (ECF subfamily)
VILSKKNISKLTDEVLMSRIKNGDSNAFNELYSRYSQRLYYFFYRMLGADPENANDFLQDIFLKVINKPELYNSSYQFSNWIFSIAHNMCKNEYRKREVRKIIQSESNTEQFVDEAAEMQNNKESLLSSLFNELERLDENQRSILILKYKENFSLKEISEILKLPVGTIKSRLHYARLELSKRVNKTELH